MSCLGAHSVVTTGTSFQCSNRSAVARELGIHPSMIRRWKEQLDENGQQASPGRGNPRDEEMAKLRRELKRIKEENAILKRPSVSSVRTIGALSALSEIPIHGRVPRQLSIVAMARVLEVSTSGYRSWCRRKESRRSL